MIHFTKLIGLQTFRLPRFVEVSAHVASDVASVRLDIYRFRGAAVKNEAGIVSSLQGLFLQCMNRFIKTWPNWRTTAAANTYPAQLCSCIQIHTDLNVSFGPRFRLESPGREQTHHDARARHCQPGADWSHIERDYEIPGQGQS